MTAPTIHVLRRRNWRFAGDYLVLLAGHVRLQSYAEADEAAKECREKNQTIRARVNPFRCGGPSLRNQTNLDADRLHDWALDQGLTPPDGDDWAAWWDAQHPQMTELQRGGMWHALDRLSFYEVIEQPQRPVVYVAVAINWQYNDNWYDADGEGGETQFAFRTREEAEVYAVEANRFQRESWEDSALASEPEEGRAFDMHYRRQSLEDLDAPREHVHSQGMTTDEVAFVEVVEVELREVIAPSKKKLHLLQRIAWSPDHHEDYRRGRCFRHESPAGTPVAAFATKEEASKCAAASTAEARRELNPFQFMVNGVEALTNRSEQELLLAIARLGHAVWISKYFDWVRWYDEIADALVEEERDAIWNLLDRLELYRVVEVEFLMEGSGDC